MHDPTPDRGRPAADDRYKYFRIEARELLDGLMQDLLALEKEGPSHARMGRLFRLAHTLKGAARVVGQTAIADRAHAIEDLLTPYRSGDVALPAEAVARALALIDATEEALAALSPPAARPAGPEPAPAIERAAEPLETVRVELPRMDRLLEGILEASVQLDGVTRQVGELESAARAAEALAERLTGSAERAAAESLATQLHAAQRRLGVGVDRLRGELNASREATRRMRLVPAATLAPQLERAARDAASTLGKHVGFEVQGGETHLEAHVLLMLRDALLHLVRNAVAHGIEPAGARRAAGKPPEGHVRVVVGRRGDRISVRIEDDGRGFDAGAIREAAVKRGLVGPEEAAALPDAAVLRLTLASGVTTRERADAIAGRGVGLDVVAEAVRRLKGELTIDNRPGRGAAIELVVPLSLASIRALVLECGAWRAAVPLEAVAGAFRVEPEDVTASPQGETVVFEGRAIPFVRLARTLGQPSRPGATSALAVRSGGALVAVGVDRLPGPAEVVVRPLPAAVGKPSLVVGAALDQEGVPLPMLDPAGLAAQAGVLIAAEEAVAAPRPILVIDDSLTTRMLEKSILESAGYEVDLASSGEEGLEKARQRPYGLFLVDVEMPGIDGFTFVERTRADAQLRETPAILVSSRAAVEDRRRGAEAGAAAYIVKGEFHQGRFLQTVKELVR